MAGRRKRKASETAAAADDQPEAHQLPVRWLRPRPFVGRRGTESNPEIVKWEVDKVSSVDDQGRNSPCVLIEGIEWYLRVRTESSERTQNEPFLSLYLYCKDKNHLEVWYADVLADVKLVNRHDRAKDKIEKFSYRFNHRLNNSGYASFIKKADLLSPAQGFILGDKIKIEVSIAILKVHGFQKIPPLYDFSYPREFLTNAVILVEGKKLHVSKQVLAINSPVFDNLFFGEEYKDKNQDEIELEDAKHDEVVEFLDAIYTPNKAITPDNCKSLLALAKYFQTRTVMRAVEHFLCTCTHYPEFPMATRLRLADQYDLFEAQNAVMLKLRKVSDIVGLKSQRDWVPISDTLKLMVTELQLKLMPRPDVINLP